LDEEFQAFADSDTDPDILTFRSSTGRWWRSLRPGVKVHFCFIDLAMVLL
jgi:hypothetical protein